MQFRLSTLLWAAPVLATSVALVGLWGIALALFCVVALWLLAKPWGKNGGRLKAVVLLIVVCVVLCLGLLWPGMEPRYRSRVLMCRNNIQQIGHALLAYEDRHDRLPPAVEFDASGRPMHSWRARILQHLDRPDLAARYDWNQPWNGPGNAAVVAASLPCYNCPSVQRDATAPTRYFAVVGPGTFWDAPRGSWGRPDSRIILVESAQGDIAWAEPKDIDREQFLAGIHGPTDDGPGIQSPHPGGLHVALANGRVEFVPLGASPELLRAMLLEGLTPKAEAELRRLRDDYAARTDPNYRLGWLLLAWFLSLAAFAVHALRVHRVRREPSPPLPDDAPGA